MPRSNTRKSSTSATSLSPHTILPNIGGVYVRVCVCVCVRVCVRECVRISWAATAQEPVAGASAAAGTQVAEAEKKHFLAVPPCSCALLL